MSRPRHPARTNRTRHPREAGGQPPRLEPNWPPRDPCPSDDAADDLRAAEPRDDGVVQHASNCRWGVPTITLPPPHWWEAEACPWSCMRGTTPHVLETTEVCATCPHWAPRGPGAIPAEPEESRPAVRT